MAVRYSVWFGTQAKAHAKWAQLKQQGYSPWIQQTKKKEFGEERTLYRVAWDDDK